MSPPQNIGTPWCTAGSSSMYGANALCAPWYTFSKVSALVRFQQKVTLEITFENVCLAALPEQGQAQLCLPKLGRHPVNQV